MNRATISCRTSSINLNPVRRDVLAGMVGLTWASAAAAKPPRVIEMLGPAAPGERGVSLTSTGIRWSEVKRGTGEVARTGDVVLIDLLGSTEDGKVFIDTKAAGNPLAFELGTTNKFITEGLSQVVESMVGGDQKLAVVPASLGYGPGGISLPQGAVPGNAKLFYEIELLRCQKFTIGLACCSEDAFPCIDKNKGTAAPGPAAAP